MDLAIAGFDWDEGNREKCQKHGVSVEEIEALFAGPAITQADLTHSRSESRRRAVGKTRGGRYVFVVFTIRERAGKPLIRPISARFMHEKEIRHYESQTTQEISPTPDRRGG